jgi:long-chain acyl-CoA synthetase
VNLAHLIDHHPAEQVAIVDGTAQLTYGDLRDRVGRLRGGLHELGVTAGDRVALVSGNSARFVEVYLAALGIGAAVVPMNPQSPAPELQRELESVRPIAAFVEPQADAAWRQIEAPALVPVRHVIAIERAGVDVAIPFERLLDAGPVPIVEVDTNDVAVLMFTSGTAGAPRAAMLSHGNLLANLEQGRSATARIRADDIVYAVLPMFHIFGLNVVVGLTLANGATLCVARRFDTATALAALRDHRVTVVAGAPTMWVDLSNADASARDFASVRLALTGAAKMPEDATRRLQERFGIDVAEGYGLTEASPVVTSSAGLPLKIGSVGKVLEGMSVRLVDDDGDDVLMGDAGEILVKGPNVFLGYLDDPTQTAAVLSDDGWLRTGDVAVTDEDGYLYLVDRAKDLIIVSGFNVYPIEVEDVIASHPAVAEVGVVGAPHAHTGETVKAWIVVRPGMALDAPTITAWCAERLARYKCPTQVRFVDALPRNVSGKLLRRALM